MKNRARGTGQVHVGIISDTHGLLRPEALKRLEGCDHIIHGGDIGNPEILQALAALAPLTVVRGNNDRQDWAGGIPDSVRLTVGGVEIYVVHDVADAKSDPQSQGAQVIISGHSHKPSVVERDGVLHVNPGSAGRRRFKLPICLAEIIIDNGKPSACILDITPA